MIPIVEGDTLSVYPAGYHHVQDAFAWQQKQAGTTTRLTKLKADSVWLSSKALMSVSHFENVVSRPVIDLMTDLRGIPGVFRGDPTGTIHYLSLLHELYTITAKQRTSVVEDLQFQRLREIRSEFCMMAWYLDALWKNRERWCPPGVAGIQELFITAETANGLGVTTDGHQTVVEQVRAHVPGGVPRHEHTSTLVILACITQHNADSWDCDYCVQILPKACSVLRGRMALATTQPFMMPNRPLRP